MSETKEKLKQFQWKKGDNFGKIETVSHEDSKFVYFENGGQIFKNVLNEFMEPIVNGTVPFPGIDKPKQNVIDKKSTQPQNIIEEPKKNQPSAIEQLVERLSKKNIEKFETSLNLNIPTKDIYNMLVENSDEDPKELIDTIAKVAVSKIEINKLQEYLTEEITNFINKYYNG